MIGTFNAKDQIRIAAQRPRPQPGQIQVMSVAKRTGGWMSTDVRIGAFELIDKPECNLRTRRGQTVIHRVLDIPVGQNS